MARSRAIYRVDGVDAEFVHLTDLDGPKSITNDAEAVVKEVYEQYGDKRILYVDTDGNKDELVHVKGVFKDFAPWRGE